MKKNRSRILIVVGQSLMLLYFVALTFQSFILLANLVISPDEQLGKILSSLMMFSLLMIVFSVIAVVYSCQKMPRFFHKRLFVSETNGISIGLSVFGFAVLSSYPTLVVTGMLWFFVLASGYCLQFFAFRFFYKKRNEAVLLQKSSESPEVKLEKFRHYHELGYLSDDDWNDITKELTAKG